MLSRSWLLSPPSRSSQDYQHVSIHLLFIHHNHRYTLEHGEDQEGEYETVWLMLADLADILLSRFAGAYCNTDKKVCAGKRKELYTGGASLLRSSWTSHL